MELPEVVEQLSIATRSLKVSTSWLQSQTEEQIRQIGGGDWLPLSSTIHDLEERVIMPARTRLSSRECRRARPLELIFAPAFRWTKSQRRKLDV